MYNDFTLKSRIFTTAFGMYERVTRACVCVCSVSMCFFVRASTSFYVPLYICTCVCDYACACIYNVSSRMATKYGICQIALTENSTENEYLICIICIFHSILLKMGSLYNLMVLKIGSINRIFDRNNSIYFGDKIIFFFSV